MIQLHIASDNYELNDKITEYVERKICRLDRYLPRSVEATGAVTLTLDQSGREDNQCVCEAIIQLPGPNLQAKEATVNMFAAVDIVEAKLKVQAMKYKDRAMGKSNRRQIFLNKLLRRDQGI